METPDDPEVQIAELRRELARLWWILRVATAAVAVVLAILAFLVFPGAKAEAIFTDMFGHTDGWPQITKLSVVASRSGLVSGFAACLLLLPIISTFVMRKVARSLWINLGCILGSIALLLLGFLATGAALVRIVQDLGSGGVP
ncbi:MAG: hypothetical protein R3F11_01015 [Verrucomicrobiales bacterium]